MKVKTMKLAWEKVGDKRVAVHKSRAEMQVNQVVPGRLQVLARAKMMDVTVISGDFLGDSVAFYPCVCLLLDSKERIEFIGTYRAKLSPYTNPESPDYIDDVEKLGKFPTFCIRRAIWPKRTNQDTISEFRAAPNKKDYIWGDVQTKVNVAFVKLENFPVVENLIADSIKLVEEGISFQDAYEPRTSFYNVHLIVADEVYFELQYYLGTRTSNRLDDLTNRWQSYLVDSPLEESIIPDEDFQIIYDRSLFDCLRDFDLIDESPINHES
jgi:hypothetical protein